MFKPTKSDEQRGSGGGVPCALSSPVNDSREERVVVGHHTTTIAIIGSTRNQMSYEDGRRWSHTRSVYERASELWPDRRGGARPQRPSRHRHGELCPDAGVGPYAGKLCPGRPRVQGSSTLAVANASKALPQPLRGNSTLATSTSCWLGTGQLGPPLPRGHRRPAVVRLRGGGGGRRKRRREKGS
jgi:hypothetical protein